MTLLLIFFSVGILLISITLREYAHGYVAYRLGDPTPKESGRLKLNPFAHLDIFGTIILPVLLFFLGLSPFGYAKPIPINPYYFKNPKKHIMWVGLAGPLMNIAIVLFLRLVAFFPLGYFYEVIYTGIIINLALAIFNLLPIPPLDGSRILASFLPYRLVQGYLRLETVGFLLITFLIITGFFKWFIVSVVSGILYFLAM